MTKEEIEQLVQSVIDKRKDIRHQLGLWYDKKDDYKKPDYPDYYSTYALAIDLAECNRYHAEKGVFPARLFSKKSPNQSPDEFTYVKDNYKQVTLPIAVDYINTITRAFNEGNFTITYPKDEDSDAVKSGNTLQDYLETEIDIYGSLENFMKFTFPALKTIDANGVIAVKPFDQFTFNTSGEKIISSTELNRPQPIYYDCSRVVAFKDEEFALIETTEVAYGEKTKKKKDFYTYEFYDLDSIWYLVYNVTDQKLTSELYKQHNWNRLPVEKIKGIPRIIDNEVLWQSQFSFATDLLDIIAVNNSMLDIVFQKCGYPIRVIVGRPCLFEYKDKQENVSMCNNGQVYDSVVTKNIDCPSCHGTGLKDRFSPLHDYMINPGDALNPGDKITAKPFSYEAPDTAIISELREYIAATEEKAKKILHIHTSNSIVRGTDNLTATGMSIDNKQMYAFIKPISDQMFDTWLFIIDAIGWFRYGTKYKAPTIQKPLTFDFNTEFDYMFEISEAAKSGLPPIMIHAIIIRYLKSHFFSDDKTSKSFNLIIATDRLIGLDNTDITIQLNKGLIADWEVILHGSAITLIDNILLVEKDLFNKKPEDQKTLLIAEAQRIATANKPKTATQDIVQTLLNGSAPVPV